MELEKIACVRHLQEAVAKANPFGDGPSTTLVAIKDIEAILQFLPKEDAEWREALRRERGNTNIYRQLWLVVEEELRELRLSLLGDNYADVDLAEEIHEEWSALAR